MRSKEMDEYAETLSSGHSRVTCEAEFTCELTGFVTACTKPEQAQARPNVSI